MKIVKEDLWRGTYQARKNILQWSVIELLDKIRLMFTLKGKNSQVVVGQEFCNWWAKTKVSAASDPQQGQMMIIENN